MESSIRRGEQGQEADEQPEVEEVTNTGAVEESQMEGDELFDVVEVGSPDIEETLLTEDGVDIGEGLPLDADAGFEVQAVSETGTEEELAPEVDAETSGESGASAEGDGTPEFDGRIEEEMAVDEMTENDLPPEEDLSQAIEAITSVQVEPAGPPAEQPRKIALILSGGGARGAFQVGAELYARQVKGFNWDIIAGVSVGAMNGTMLAMHRYRRLLEIWDSISNEQVYSGGFNLLSILKLLMGAKSFYSNEPLQRMMKRELEAGKVIDDLYVGAVSLVSGEYVQFTKEFLELSNAILASTAIPVVWPPVDVSPEHPGMVDGGVRNNSPVGDVLHLEPDEIVIINCSRETPAVLPEPPDNVLDIGLRALDILQNEIFVNDVKEFLRINDLVKEAQDQGAVLHHPRTGRVLKYYPYVLIEPDEDLGGTLDFSRAAVQASIKAGVKRAREVLGRP